MMSPSLVLHAAALVAAVPLPDTQPITVTAHPWAPFISPMGEPFRARTTSDDTLAAWFRAADRNHDGELTSDEMIADAERFFVKLDTNHNGEIDPDEVANYEWEIAPEIQVNSRTRRPPGTPGDAAEGRDQDLKRPKSGRKGADDEQDSSLALHGALQGAARYGLLNIPEPVVSADTDLNRAVSREEFRQAAAQRFRLLDTNNRGQISLDELEALRASIQGAAARHGHGSKDLDGRVGTPVPREP